MVEVTVVGAVMHEVVTLVVVVEVVTGVGSRIMGLCCLDLIETMDPLGVLRLESGYVGYYLNFYSFTLWFRMLHTCCHLELFSQK